MSDKKDLVQIIRDNPGCVAVVDNDGWRLHRRDPNECPEFGNDYASERAWTDHNDLARDGEVIELGDGFATGRNHGADILQALAAIVGIKVLSA